MNVWLFLYWNGLQASLKKVFKKIIFNHWFFSAADRGDEDEMSKRDETYGYLYGKQKLRKFA